MGSRFPQEEDIYKKVIITGSGTTQRFVISHVYFYFGVNDVSKSFQSGGSILSLGSCWLFFCKPNYVRALCNQIEIKASKTLYLIVESSQKVCFKAYLVEKWKNMSRLWPHAGPEGSYNEDDVLSHDWIWIQLQVYGVWHRSTAVWARLDVLQVPAEDIVEFREQLPSERCFWRWMRWPSH